MKTPTIAHLEQAMDDAARFVQISSEGEIYDARLRCPWHGLEFGTYVNCVSVAVPWNKEKLATIDACMVVECKLLWDKGIHTLESCCGHGKQHGYIAVRDEDMAAMDALGYQRDPRAPHVFLARTHTAATSRPTEQALRARAEGTSERAE